MATLLSPFRNLLFTLAFLSVFAVFTQAGCKHKQTVYISHPQVFTRERLISQRSEEIAWLHDELDNFDGYYKEGIQGRINEKLLDMLALSFKAEINPGGLGGVTPITPASTPDATGGDSAGEQNGQAEESKDTNAENKEASDKEKLEAARFAAKLSSNFDSFFKDGADPNADLSADGPLGILPSERLKDERAYRDAIRQAIREELLDDVHDINGQLLYDLKFDLTMAPPDDGDSELRAVVIKAKDLDYNALKENTGQLAELRTAWQQAVIQQISDEAIDLYARIKAIDPDNPAISSRTESRLASILSDPSTIQQQDKLADDIREQYQARIQQSKNIKSDPVLFELWERAPTDVGAAFSFYMTVSKDSARFAKLYSDWYLKAAAGDMAQNLEVSLSDLIKAIQEKPVNEGRLDIATFVARYYESRLDGRIKKMCFPGEQKGTSVIKVCVEEAALYGFTTQVILFDDRDVVDCACKLHDPEQNRATEPSTSAAYRLDRRIDEVANHLKLHMTNKPVPPATLSAAKNTEKEARGDGNDTFFKMLKALNISQDAHTYVVAVKPTELAQNISDSSVSRKIISTMFEGSGQVLPELGVGGKLETLYDHQLAMQAIQRKPLLMGFNSGSHDFGWIVGPRFRIAREGKWFNKKIRDSIDFDFAHVPVRHSVAATIVAPAWQRDLTLEVSTFRIDQDTGEWVPEESNETAIEAMKPVSLPGDMSALTKALLAHEDPLSLDPVIGGAGIDISREDLKWTLRAGEANQSMLVLGRNLWRSPQVYVGGVRADKVEIISDLQGLHVTFTKPLPEPAIPGEAHLDLTIVTSQGHDVLSSAVNVLPPRSRPQVKYVSLTSRHTYVEQTNSKTDFGELAFAIDKTKLPSSWHNFVVYARPHKQVAKAWIELGGTFDLAGTRDRATFTFSRNPFTQDKKLAENELYDIDVRVVPSPGSTGRSVLDGKHRTIALLSGKARHTIEIKEDALSMDGSDLEISIGSQLDRRATILQHIYPRLGSSLYTGATSKVRVVLTTDTITTPVATLPADLALQTKGNATLTFDIKELNKVFNKKSGSELSYGLHLMLGDDDPQRIPLTGKIKIKLKDAEKK